MSLIHVRNLERYHPGYKDRELKWAKVYFSMVDGDPEFEMIHNEIDKWRFVAIICLELRAQKPIPNNDTYWKRKGFDLRKRAMSLTLDVLQPFIEFVTEEGEDPLRIRNVEKRREEKKRGEEMSVTRAHPDSFDEVNEYFIHLRLKDEARKFYDHFNANGWKVSGRYPMKDWKAAARNWCRRAVETYGKKLDPLPKKAPAKDLPVPGDCPKCNASKYPGEPCPNCEPEEYRKFRKDRS